MNNKNYDNVMHLGNPTNTIAVLNRYGFNFQKKFGQNFLIDENVVKNRYCISRIAKMHNIVIILIIHISISPFLY